MDTRDIEYSTVEQQLSKLQSQGLIICNKEFAISQLKCYGYSNLIKSYRKPYIIIENGKKIYRSGVTFEQIASLHELDKNVRNTVMSSLQDLEEHFKELSADVIARSFGTAQDDYLKFRNYQNKRKSIEKFQLGSILDSLKTQLQSPKDPIHHYYTKYGVVPPWILFKSVYFSTMVNFIDQFKIPQQTELMQRLLEVENIKTSEYGARLLMMDILFVSMEYRNNAAHGGRMFDFLPRNIVRGREIFGSEFENFSPCFTAFIDLLDFLRYKNPHYQLHEALTKEINRHCNLFPQDVTYLGQLLNINIESRKVVYITEKSNKYHHNPTCSGIQNTTTVDLSYALENGYIPCKRCCKEEE